jgi:hypothetical protein
MGGSRHETGSTADPEDRRWGWARIGSLGRSALISPLGLGLLLVLPSVGWIVLDRSVWSWDPAWYGQASVDLYATLRSSPIDWLQGLAHTLPTKGPAIAWFGEFFVPLHRLVGSHERALLLSTIPVQAGSIALVFAAARRITSSSAAGIAAALMLAGSPLFLGVGHAYFAEPIQALAVAWILFVMVSARRWRPAFTVTQLALATMLGLLVKVSTPIYVALPALTALTGAVAVRRRRTTWPPVRDDIRLQVSTLIAGLCALAAVIWYWNNLGTALAHARLSANSTYWGTSAGFGSKLWSWVDRLDASSFVRPFDAAFLLIASTVVVLALRRGRPRLLPTYRAGCYGACIVTVIGTIALFSLHTGDDSRFLLPLMPLIAVTLSGLFLLTPSRLGRFALIAVVASQFLVANLKTFTPATSTLVSYTGGPEQHRLITSPDRSRGLRHDLDELVSLSCVPGRQSSALVLAEYPWLNHNTLQFIAHQARWSRNCRYTSLPLGESGTQASKHVLGSKASYLVSIDFGSRANLLMPDLRRQVGVAYKRFNRTNRPMFRRLIRSTRFQIVPGSRQGGFVVFRRRMDKPS